MIAALIVERSLSCVKNAEQQ